MVAQYLDLTDELAANGYAQFETSNYDYAVVQIIGNGGDMLFNATLDSGAVQGVTDGSIYTSDNYLTVGAIKLADNTYITTTSADGLFRFNLVARYIRLSGTADKLLVMLTKIS